MTTALTIAISPCPNDSFIFAALALGLTPKPEGRDCRFFWHDVQELNQNALTWDVTKVSAAMALRLQDSHVILSSGGAFGCEHGPKLVTRPDFRGQPKRIAVPGLDTTAMLVLSAALPSFTAVPMRFDAIVEAVATGQTDAGLLIHETALVYAQYGLTLHTDLGLWWAKRSQGLPLPLGCIVAKRNLGPRLHAALDESIRASIHHARRQPDHVQPLIAALAKELDAATLEQHIAAYVNAFSLDMGTQGLEALNMLHTFRNTP